MGELKEFTVAEARPLPVILLADVSGSMHAEGKIQAMNQAVKEMLATLADEDDLRAEYHLCVITFGAGGAKVHTPLQPVSKVTWDNMEADGRTPMGAAMLLAAELMEDKARIPDRAFRPAIILVSDGHPTDNWEKGLKRLAHEGRAAKADRMALAIGGDADTDVLKRFVNDPEIPLFYAEDARGVKEFFAFATISLTSRSRSANPNQKLKMELDDSLRIEGDFVKLKTY